MDAATLPDAFSVSVFHACFGWEFFLAEGSNQQGKPPTDGRFRKCGTWMSLTSDPDGTTVFPFCLEKPHPKPRMENRNRKCAGKRRGIHMPRRLPARPFIPPSQHPSYK